MVVWETDKMGPHIKPVMKSFGKFTKECDGVFVGIAAKVGSVIKAVLGVELSKILGLDIVADLGLDAVIDLGGLLGGLLGH